MRALYILLGDFNARVGRNHDIWHGVNGHHGVGNMNSSALRLLSLCSEFGLAITNTFFQLCDMHKTSWMYPRSKHWHLVDYVIVKRRDFNKVQITRAMRGADCSTDHHLICSTLSLSHISMTTTLNCTSNLTIEWQALSSALLISLQSTLNNMEG